MKSRFCRFRWRAKTFVVGVAYCAQVGCRSHPVPSDAGASASGGAPGRVDCVDVLRVDARRGSKVANVRRFGESNPSLRISSRLGDLGPEDRRSFCDWEACMRTNGYGHTCWVNDAGWERCRVCDGAADCDGRPLDQDDCVANAIDPGRAQCHVGLLQECLIQRALRGPADPRPTRSCQLSDQACGGGLNGDLSAEALVAQHETDQVTVQLCGEELERAAELEPDAYPVTYWQNQLSLWEGGLPPDESDAATIEEGDVASVEAGDF